MSSAYAYPSTYSYNPAQYPQGYSQQYYPRQCYTQSPQHHQHHRYPNPYRPMSGQPSQGGDQGRTTEQPSSPSSSSSAADARREPFYPCLEQTCAARGVGFKRKADLERHYRVTHEWATTERFDCEHPFCSRKGSNGFTRKDKMVDHMREVHDADLPKRQGAGRRRGS